MIFTKRTEVTVISSDMRNQISHILGSNQLELHFLDPKDGEWVANLGRGDGDADDDPAGVIS